MSVCAIIWHTWWCAQIRGKMAQSCARIFFLQDEFLLALTSFTCIFPFSYSSVLLLLFSSPWVVSTVSSRYPPHATPHLPYRHTRSPARRGSSRVRRPRRSSEPHFQTRMLAGFLASTPPPRLVRTLRQSLDVLARSSSIAFGRTSPPSAESGPAFECRFGGGQWEPHRLIMRDAPRLSGVSIRFPAHDHLVQAGHASAGPPSLLSGRCLGQLNGAPTTAAPIDLRPRPRTTQMRVHMHPSLPPSCVAMASLLPYGRNSPIVVDCSRANACLPGEALALTRAIARTPIGVVVTVVGRPHRDHTARWGSKTHDIPQHPTDHDGGGGRFSQSRATTNGRVGATAAVYSAAILGAPSPSPALTFRPI